MGDQLGEFSENLEQAQGLLLPQSPVTRHDMEIGISYYKGLSLGGLYCDFLELPEHEYGVVIGESSAKGAIGLIQTAMFRGMIRALWPATPNPAELAILLNELLLKEQIPQVFAFSFLILNPTLNQLSYLSSSHGGLWLIKKAHQMPEKMVSESVALGLSSSTPFISASQTWNVGDILILTNSRDSSQESAVLNDNKFSRLLMENSSYSPQKQADSIMRKLKISSLPSIHGAVAIISLVRNSA